MTFRLASDARGAAATAMTCESGSHRSLTLVRELATDPVVRAYGWAVLAGHLSGWLYLYSSGMLNSIRRGVEPLCWPYFESCWQFRLDTAAGVGVLLAVNLALILLAAALLAERRYASFWFTLLILNVFVFSIVSLDYRLRGNQFYMLLWLNIVYLFSPSKRVSIPLVIISFYFWAGILKVNYEWLSGAVLYHDLWLIPARFVPAACAYVVVLELILIWGLRSSKAFIFYAVLAQLAVFHVQSLSQIHWFYPLLMTTVLSWFVIERQLDHSHAATSTSVWSRRMAWGYVAPMVFAGFQLLPYAYAGNPDLTGKGRVFALHMFAAKPVCEVTATIRSSTGTTSTVDLQLRSFPPRMICDPVVYFSRAKNLCRERARLAVEDFDLLMRSRRTTDTTLVTITDQPSFCGGNFSYSVYGRNDWMSDPHAPQRTLASVETR